MHPERTDAARPRGGRLVIRLRRRHAAGSAGRAGPPDGKFGAEQMFGGRSRPDLIGGSKRAGGDMAPTYAERPRRVLGVDPGLTRCGLGVVEGDPGRALGLVGVGVVRTPPDADVGVRLLALEDQIEAWLTAHQPDAVAVERVFSQRNVRTVMGTAQAGAVAIVCAARRGLPVALHTPERGQGGRNRQRPGGQAAGDRDGGAAAAAHRPAPARRRRGRAGAGHLPPVAGRRALPPGSGRASAAASARAGPPASARAQQRHSGGISDIASARNGQRRRPRRRGDRGRRGRAQRPVHAGDAGDPAAGRAGPRRDLPGGPGGLAHAVRLRQRRRTERLRARADRHRRRPPAGAGHARRAQPGRAAARGLDRGPGRADLGPRDRQEGRAAHRPGTQGPARRAR